MSDWYVLNDDHTVTRVSFEDYIARTPEERARDEKNRRVAETTWGPFWVSTVFLGLDHQHGDGPPLIFETMVFLQWPVHEGDIWCGRWSTWNEAVAGHLTACGEVKKWEMWRVAAGRIPGALRHIWWCTGNEKYSTLSKRYSGNWWRVMLWIRKATTATKRGWQAVQKVYESWRRSFLGGP